MRIFLTGATGYVGSVVAEKLLEGGHEVIGLARNKASEAKLIAKGVKPLRGDLTDLESLRRGASEADGVVHTAFGHDFANFGKMVQEEIDAVNAIVEVIEGSNKPLIATSAPAFLGDTGEIIADETYPIDENSYFVVRAASERNIVAAAEKGVRSVALRLPFYVYGRGGSLFIPFLIGLAQQNGAAYYVGEGAEKTSAAHVDDVANAYVLALETETAKGLYNIVAENISNKTIAESIARNVGVATESISPTMAAEKFGAMIGFFTINNQISADKAKRELGWQASDANSITKDIEYGSYKN